MRIRHLNPASECSTLIVAALASSLSLGIAFAGHAGTMATPSATPTATASAAPTAVPTPTAPPGLTCVEENPLSRIVTTGKSNSPTNNAKVTHAITGNIVDPTSLSSSAHRITVCRGTTVTAVVSDTTDVNGRADNSANSDSIECASFGCQAFLIQSTQKYISRSDDGTDTDRITLVVK